MSKTVHISMNGKGFRIVDRKKLERSLHSVYKKYLAVFNEAERSVWIFWLGSIKIGLAKIRFKVIGTPSGRHGQQSFPLGPSIANHSISLSCWKSPFRH